MASPKKTIDEQPIQVPRFGKAGGFHTTQQRSRLMAKIRGKDTKAELLLRRGLWAKGIRFRIHVKNMPGRPDIVSNKYRLAIFVDGAFWHGYQWHKKKTGSRPTPYFGYLK
ncbi:Very short patch repair protein [compost metagenome]